MITYKITVTALGKITQLLDSQKIFGALMYLLSDFVKKQEMDDFIAEISARNRVFMVSSLIPENYLPIPYIETQHKEDYKELKSKKFIPINAIGDSMRELKDYIKIEESQDAKYRISNEFFDIPGLKNDLFSIPIIKILKGNKELKHFDFYLAFDSKNGIISKLVTQLERLKREKSHFLFGQKASQGYNTYRVQEVEDVTTNLMWEDAEYYLNLGMFLPNSEKSVIDYEKSKLKLFTSERRPYQMGIGQGQFERNNNFISFIEVGSVIKLRSDIEMGRDRLCHAGKSVESPYQHGDEKRIVFGQSFLYPLKGVPKL